MKRSNYLRTTVVFDGWQGASKQVHLLEYDGHVLVVHSGGWYYWSDHTPETGYDSKTRH